MVRSEKMKPPPPPPPPAPASCVLWFTFVFFNLGSGLVDVTVGPRPGYNYSADNMWVTAWPRSEWSAPAASDKEPRQEKRESECMSASWRRRGVEAEQEDAELQANICIFWYLLYRLHLSTWSLWAWLACAESNWYQLASGEDGWDVHPSSPRVFLRFRLRLGSYWE